MPPRKTPFAEVFPIRRDTLPQLYGYRLVLHRGDTTAVGSKLAYRLRQETGAHWAVSRDLVMNATVAAPPTLDAMLHTLKGEQPEIFKALHHVTREATWQATAQVEADFAVRALFPSSMRGYSTY